MLIIFVSIHLEHCLHFIFKYNSNLSLSFSNCLLYYDLTRKFVYIKFPKLEDLPFDLAAVAIVVYTIGSY
jgi:hypothetical protein